MGNMSHSTIIKFCMGIYEDTNNDRLKDFPEAAASIH